MAKGSSVDQVVDRSDTEPSPASDNFEGKSTVPNDVASGWRRLMLLAFAAIFFSLGLLGVLLPGIPATPFLLLTSYFLVRSSPRLNDRLLRSRLFGKILIDWQVHGGVRTHVRYKAIVAVVVAVAVSVYLTGYSPPATLTVVLLAMIGIAVVLKLPAAKDP